MDITGSFREAENIAIVRKCAWCGESFTVKSLFSRDKYCDKHKKEAQKSNVLKAMVKYYKKNKKEREVKQLGTISLGPHLKLDVPLTYLGLNIPYSEFIKEQKVIQNNNCNNNGIKGIYKRGITNNNVWIDNSCHLEYGEPQPSGIQNTHKYATFDDYYYTAKHYLLKDRGPCPECGCKEHYKTDIDISCSECGLILETNPNKMGSTEMDVIDSEHTKKRKEIVCPECGKIQTIILNSESVLKDKYFKCPECEFIIQDEIKEDIKKIVGPFSTIQDISWDKYWNKNAIGEGCDEGGM